MKKLLITTQKVDEADDHFVFFLDWIRAFSKHYEKVAVIALFVGKYELPPNVVVYSLGKEKHSSRFKRLVSFLRYIVVLRKDYDNVFVHMNPEYVIVGGLLWRLWGKKIGLWYTHRAVNLRLRIAHFFSNVVFTAVLESFRIPSKKVHIVGHGINTDLFHCSSFTKRHGERIVLTTVSRIAPIKHLETIVEALPKISALCGRDVELRIISKLPKENDTYYKMLREKILFFNLAEKVHFLGAIPGGGMPRYYCESDFTINLTPTGGLDKAFLESLSSGIPCFASNEALKKIMHPFEELLIVLYNDPDILAKKVAHLVLEEPTGLREALRKVVVSEYGYEKLIDRIKKIYDSSF